MIKIYGMALSPYVRKVLAVLKLKGLDYELVPQMPFANDPEFRKISPLEKIPALRDGDLTLCDSSVICEYLEDAYPATAVYPSDAKAKAQARWLEELGDSKLAEFAGGIFFQRFMRPNVFQQEADEAVVQDLIDNKLPPIFDYLEALVPDDGFLFGDLGVADVSVITALVNAGYAGFQVDASRWPKFSAYVGRVHGHEVVAGLLAAEQEAMGAGA